jgi:hypothetical protein
VSAKNAPAKWPEAFQRTWRVEIGEGLLIACSRRRKSLRSRPPRSGREIVAGINLADGKVLWQPKYQADFKKNQYAVQMAKGPNSTPLVMGNRLFTLGVTGVLNTWDTATGWLSQAANGRRPRPGRTRTSLMYMSSPVFGDGLIYGHSSKKKGQFVAIDAKTGALKWATEGREGSMHLSLLTPQHVIFLTNGADRIVAKRGTPRFCGGKALRSCRSSDLGDARAARFKRPHPRRYRRNAIDREVNERLHRV